jgi:hypothetical protein
VIRCNNDPLHLQSIGRKGQTKKQIKKEKRKEGRKEEGLCCMDFVVVMMISG